MEFPEDFIGSGSPRVSNIEKFRISSAAIPALNVQSSSEEPNIQCKETVCLTSPSESSESISPITQIDNPAYHGPKAPAESSAIPAVVADEVQEDKPDVNLVLDSEEHSVAKVNTQSSIRKEDQPSDLRVFELNSDSGKSTPSNNGQKGSSTDVSEDWEKDFDMTEEEVQMALSRVEVSGETPAERLSDFAHEEGQNGAQDTRDPLRFPAVDDSPGLKLEDEDWENWE
ncbi:hypothetical protein AB205_0053600 [Aquarana catesbeiana]|uniref:BSD domain-containing protein n=1 Tax=Aquarana catesbeiana TaxID=8400 RepID=A0A2G9R524_AQUCT|nr:hypothetical protein AB205_0053600 [Aquarana catesbeiana]